MDKSNNTLFENTLTHGNINGNVTSESYNTYSSIRNPKNNLRISKITLYLFISLLLIGSALIFVHSIKTAFFTPSAETVDTGANIKTIRTNYDNNEVVKVENVTNELSDLFNIPVGVRIIDFESQNSNFSGLQVNDIIVEVSGIDVTNIDDMDMAVKQSIATDGYVVAYKVYRNGGYTIINPQEQQ